MGKVSVTFEFDSPEAAIAALGKYTGLAPAADKAPRKPRADAGKERGPHKDKPPVGQPPVVPPVVPPAANPSVNPTQTGGNASSAATDTSNAGSAATSTSTSAQGSASSATSGAATKAAGGAPATPEQTQAAMEELFNAKGLETAKLVLSRFGAPRVRDLLPEQRAEFVVKAKAVAALPEKQGTPEFDTKVQAVFAA